MSHRDHVDAESAPFELKGSMVTVTELRLFDTDLKRLSLHLSQTVEQAPAMFQRMPVVVDLQHLAEGEAEKVEFDTLARLLRAQDLLPVGVRNAPSELEERVVNAGFGLMPASRRRPAAEPSPAPHETPTDGEAPAVAAERQGDAVAVVDPEAMPAAGEEGSTHTTEAPDAGDTTPEVNEGVEEATTDAEPPLRPAPKVVTQPVRSGQRVYSQGDLVVFASVSPGAELIADGSIHVYGKLSGRALAGSGGNTNARIFCQALDAELLAVAGAYRVFEEPLGNLKGKQVQVYLDGEKLIIDPV